MSILQDVNYSETKPFFFVKKGIKKNYSKKVSKDFK